jgi:hypothetical protein
MAGATLCTGFDGTTSAKRGESTTPVLANVWHFLIRDKGENAAFIVPGIIAPSPVAQGPAVICKFVIVADGYLRKRLHHSCPMDQWRFEKLQRTVTKFRLPTLTKWLRRVCRFTMTVGVKRKRACCATGDDS